MKEDNRARDSKSSKDNKSTRRSHSRELRKRHEDGRIRNLVAGQSNRGQDKSRDDNTRKRQDDRRKRSRTPQIKSARVGRRRTDESGRDRVHDTPLSKQKRKEIPKAECQDATLANPEAMQEANGEANFMKFARSKFHSGFVEKGFSNFADSGSHRNAEMDESKRSGTQAKPRILAPNNVGKDVSKEFLDKDAPNFTVNELSAESIKREHPMKGTNQRRILPSGGNFGMKRQHAFIKSGASFTGSKRIQHIRPGRTFDGFNSTSKTIQPIEIRKPETEQAAVPRGRKYFIHDHRDVMFENQSNLTKNRYGQERKAPIGWRNFSDSEGTINKFNFATQNYGRGGAVGGGSARGGFAKFGNWRSKADEDLIWKHDKYVEVSQDEANTKLELIDEVGADPQQGIFKTVKQEGESRHRYQECLDYEVEELAVYD